jgi:hypothetical protein
MMLLDDAVRGFMSCCKQSGVRRVMHGVIGTAARAFGCLSSQKQSGFVQGPLGFLDI